MTTKPMGDALDEPFLSTILEADAIADRLFDRRMPWPRDVVRALVNASLERAYEQGRVDGETAAQKVKRK